MIIMNKRTLRVPADEAQLGVRTETGAEKRIIRVPRLWSCEDGTVDLSEKTVRLWYTPPSGNGDSGVISAVCSGDAINIVWEIDDRVTAESGRVLVWLQFFSEGFNLQTEEAEFFVSRVRKPSETIAYRYPNELEAWEMRMDSIASRAETALTQAAGISAEGGTDGGTLPEAFTVTLDADGWVNGEQTVYDAKFTNEDTTVYEISSAPTGYDAYIAAGIRAYDVNTEGECTFACGAGLDTPDGDIDVYILKTQTRGTADE